MHPTDWVASVVVEQIGRILLLSFTTVTKLVLTIQHTRPFPCSAARRLAIPFLLALLGLLGCGKSQTDWLKQSTEAAKAAEAAWRNGDAKSAKQAHQRAQEAVARLQALARKNPQGQEWQGLVAQATAAEVSARSYAERAEEERRKREKLLGLKLRTYQKARSTMLSTLLPPFAKVATKAAERGQENLNPFEQQVAESALRLFQLTVNRPTNSTAAPDWAAVASDLQQWSTNQPIEFRAFLGLTFVMLRQSDFALAEFESVDQAQLQSTNSLRLYHGGRALLYAMQGWNHLAAPEAEAFTRYSASANEPLASQHLLACLHGLLAFEAAEKREFAKMDAEIAQCFRVWPDNPIAVFLTGEKLAANGQWEKAAESLEKACSGTQDAWIAQRLAQRARDLREGRGSTKALFFDARFLFQVGAHMTVRAATDSGLARRSADLLESASAFGSNFLQKINFIGGGAAKPQAEISTNEPATLK